MANLFTGYKLHLIHTADTGGEIYDPQNNQDLISLDYSKAIAAVNEFSYPETSYYVVELTYHMFHCVQQYQFDAHVYNVKKQSLERQENWGPTFADLRDRLATKLAKHSVGRRILYKLQQKHERLRFERGLPRRQFIYFPPVASVYRFDDPKGSYYKEQ